MKLLEWLRHPNRAAWPAYALVVVAACWSVFRIYRSFQILFAVSDDLYTYFAIWSLMQYREMADIAVRQSLYLPHTWFFVTPLFLFGFPVGRALALMLNISAVLFIWWRLCQLAELRGVKRALMLVLFTSWLSTGLVLGLGNLALVCVALVLAAFPFTTAPQGVWLAFAAMKQSIAFPIYFQLLLRRPKSLIIPCAIFGVCGLLIMWWARLNPADVLRMVQRASHSVSTWTQYDHTCIRRLFVHFVEHKGVLSMLSWGTWFALFAIAFKWIKDPLNNLAAMFLLCLLPMYHNIYDLVVAAPALAVLLRRTPLVWPAVMTLALATNLGSHLPRFMPEGLLRRFAEALDYAYYPIVILVLFAILVWLDQCGRETRNSQKSSEPTRQPSAVVSP